MICYNIWTLPSLQGQRQCAGMFGMRDRTSHRPGPLFSLCTLVSGSRHREIYCGCREPIHDWHLFYLLHLHFYHARGGLQLPRIRPVLLRGPSPKDKCNDIGIGAASDCKELSQFAATKKRISRGKCDFIDPSAISLPRGMDLLAGAAAQRREIVSGTRSRSSFIRNKLINVTVALVGWARPVS